MKDLLGMLWNLQELVPWLVPAMLGAIATVSVIALCVIMVRRIGGL